MSAAAPLALALSSQRAFATPRGGDWRTLDIVTSVDVAGADGATQLWLPVPRARAGN